MSDENIPARAEAVSPGGTGRPQGDGLDQGGGSAPWMAPAISPLHFARALEQVDEAVTITDRDGHIEYVNPAFERETGWPAGEALGKTPRILKSGRHPEDFYREMWGCLLSGRSFRGVFLNRRKDGSLYYEGKTITPLRDAGGAVTHYLATGVDVTHQTLAEQRLRASAERSAASLRGTNDGFWDWDLMARRISFSPRWTSMLGYGEDEVKGDLETWLSLVHPEDRPEFEERLRAHLNGATEFFVSEHRMRTKPGSPLWVLTRGQATRDPAGVAVRMAGSQTDISARIHAEERLKHGALHDSLTELPNRTLFMDHLRSAISRAQRNEGSRFAVYYMDLDRFKIINDGMGHLAGDQLLVEVGRRLRSCLRDSDMLARLGGDEYAILAEGVVSGPEALAFANRFLAQFAAPFSIEGRDVFTSGSIGIALSNPSYDNPAEMVRDADTAMYHAKSRGRSMAAIFDPSMRSQARRLLDLETGLRQAVEASRLSVNYQPIVSLTTRRVAGFEALVRWLHPKWGYVSPVEFIPVAEECGLIHPVGRFVLREACRKLKVLQTRYPSRPPLTMSVNLSGVQFLRPDLLNQIDMVMREFGLDPRDLHLEITESVIIENAEYARQMIDQIRAQNVRLSIDDFGTGYSSMANLKKLPIHTVKIDQSFVKKMKEDDESLEIVRATISMAHNLGMSVIAEGVENPDEVKILSAMKCEFGQGYLFAKPLNDEAVENLLSKGGFL